MQACIRKERHTKCNSLNYTIKKIFPAEKREILPVKASLPKSGRTVQPVRLHIYEAKKIKEKEGDCRL